MLLLQFHSLIVQHLCILGSDPLCLQFHVFPDEFLMCDQLQFLLFLQLHYFMVKFLVKIRHHFMSYIVDFKFHRFLNVIKLFSLVSVQILLDQIELKLLLLIDLLQSIAVIGPDVPIVHLQDSVWVLDEWYT